MTPKFELTSWRSQSAYKNRSSYRSTSIGGHSTTPSKLSCRSLSLVIKLSTLTLHECFTRTIASACRLYSRQPSHTIDYTLPQLNQPFSAHCRNHKALSYKSSAKLLLPSEQILCYFATIQLQRILNLDTPQLHPAHLPVLACTCTFPSTEPGRPPRTAGAISDFPQ